MMDEPEPGFRSFDKEAAEQPARPIPDEVAGYDMLYSSGTTGRPKGIKKEFENNPIDVPNAFLRILCADMCGMSSDSIYLSPAPLYHAAPLRFNMMAITLGGTSIIMEHFDAEEFLKLVEKYQVTQSQLVPTMFVRMLKLPDEVRDALRRLVAEGRGPRRGALPGRREGKDDRMVGADPHRVLRRHRRQRRHSLDLAAMADPSRHRRPRRRRQDQDPRRGRRGAPTGQIGRCISPTRRFSPITTIRRRRGSAYNAKGWSTLGDVGYLDAEGYLYLTDRKSYMIISGGVNIYPQETENVLITHPAVADVAVFGVPNEEMGEEVKAVVQPHDMQRPARTRGRTDRVLPRASVADQVPEEHRLRGRTAAHADRQAGEAAFARQVLAEFGGEDVAFFPSPLVGEGALAKPRRMRGLSPRKQLLTRLE